MPSLMRCGCPFRKALAAEFSARIAAAVAGGHLPEQDAAARGQGFGRAFSSKRLIGPLAQDAAGRERELVQSLTLIALRALGVADARARGLVVQTRAAAGRRALGRQCLAQMRKALGQ